jgi:predicted Ser/Thr protein kinase
VNSDSLLPRLQHALAGRYALERRLGRGGMGLVYLARDVRLERRVAIKLLPPGRAVEPAARERFLREARTAAQLSHPGIVPIFAVEEVQDLVFFAMAYVDGETLGQRVRGDGPLGYAALARLLEEVARALAHAHARGVVHRDVKPDNILIDGATGRAHVSDFGIAWVDGSTTTGPRRVVGTADFMSPEQARGGPVDARSDLYSLGVVGFFALSGRLPFEGPDAATVLARHVTDPPPPLASVVADVPPRLAGVIERCLSKDPAARYPTGDALADAVAQALDRRPAVAVRAFLTEARHLAPAARAYAAVASVALALLGFQAAGRGALWGRAAALAAAAVIVALPLLVMLRRVRRLVRGGFGRGDLIEALRAELAHQREELAFLYGEGPTRLERAWRYVCYAALAVAAGAVAAVAWVPAVSNGPAVLAVGAGAAALALLAAVGARARTELRTDPAAARRLRFWKGRVGRWLFGLAAPRRGPRDRAARDAAAARALTPATPAP